MQRNCTSIVGAALHADQAVAVPVLADRLACFCMVGTSWCAQIFSSDVSVCRLPVHLHEVMMKSRKAEKELQASLQRDPSQAEIAERVGITEQRLHQLRKVVTCTNTSLSICCVQC